MLLSLTGFAQFSSNLPIVKLLINQSIVDTYRQATLLITDNSSGINNVSDPATFTSNAAVKLRGNALAKSYPKKSYSLETRLGNNSNNNVSVLGLPAENDWVLLAAYTDRSLLRSKLSLELHDEMDRYAPRMKYCELFLDTVYAGVYLFGEKIKRDTARLDLANLRVIDNFGDELTGGYIFGIDDEAGGGFTSKFAPPYAASSQQIKYLYEHPDNGTITPAQKAYIQSYIDSFEIALNGSQYQDSLLGWRPFAADNSLIDFLIINEVTKNYDAYRKDMFLYKDKLKQMRPGPLWGFDNSFANTSNCGVNAVSGFAYDLGSSCNTQSNLPSFWWSKLLSDTAFESTLKCRYSQFRMAGNVLDTSHIFMLIDSFVNELSQNGALVRNFSKYPIFGVPIINEPQPMATDFASEVSNMKTFIQGRLAWLDMQWLSTNCIPLSNSNYEYQRDYKVYPNPSNGLLTIVCPTDQKRLYTIRSVNGQMLMQGVLPSQKNMIDVQHLPKGLYLLLIDQGEQRSMHRLIIE